MDLKSGSGNSGALEAIFEILEREGTLDYATTRKLQTLLKEQGYNENYNVFKNDGHAGHLTQTDIVNVLKDHPDAVARLSQSIKKLLVNNGFGSELAAIATANDVAKASIAEKTAAAVGSAESVKILGKSNLEIFQANAALAGTYHAKVDGVAGTGSAEAFRLYKEEAKNISARSETPDPVTETARNYTASAPQESDPLVEPQDGAAENFDAAKDFGVSDDIFKKAWSLVKANVQSLADVQNLNVTTGSSKKPLVVIDLGHKTQNGALEDKGARSPLGAHLDEIAVIDPLGFELAKQLHKKGFEVTFTRYPGEALPYQESEGMPTNLEARTEFTAWVGALKGQSPILISLHSNSSTNPNLKGSFVYAAAKEDNLDGRRDFGVPGHQQSLDLGRQVAERLQIKPGQRTTLQTADFSVLCNIQNYGIDSAILIEPEYLSNASGAKELEKIVKDPSKVASQIADGVDNYYRAAHPASMQLASQPAADKPKI